MVLRVLYRGERRPHRGHPTDGGMMLIHQHRAHLQILFAQCLARLKDHDGQVQQLLFPDIWDIDKADIPLIESLQTDLRGLGFDMTALTPSSYSISGVPAILGTISPLPVLRKILDSVRETGLSARGEWEQKVALSMADASAIPSGKSLTQSEMQHLTENLFQLPNYRYTPDGKTIVTLLNQEQLDKLLNN